MINNEKSCPDLGSKMADNGRYYRPIISVTLADYRYRPISVLAVSVVHYHQVSDPQGNIYIQTRFVPDNYLNMAVLLNATQKFLLSSSRVLHEIGHFLHLLFAKPCDRRRISFGTFVLLGGTAGSHQ